MTLEVSQQLSRFHLETLERAPDADIDIHDITLAIVSRATATRACPTAAAAAEQQQPRAPVTAVTSLLESARLTLRSGVRYGFVGPNGAGKSALCRAIASRAIKGLNPRSRVLLVSPSGGDGAQAAAGSADTTALAAAAAAEADADADARTVLDVVLESDPDRVEAAADTAALEAAIDRLDAEAAAAAAAAAEGDDENAPPTAEHVAAALALIGLVERLDARSAASEAKAAQAIAAVRSRRRGREARHAANKKEEEAGVQAKKAAEAEAEAAAAAAAAAAGGDDDDDDGHSDDGEGGEGDGEGDGASPSAAPAPPTTLPDPSTLSAARQRASELLASLYEREADYEPELESHRAAQVLSGLGVSAEKQQAPLRALSGGWRARVRLACALFACGAGASSGGRRGVDLLILDEPTTHLDLPGIMWLRRWLCQGGGGGAGGGGGGGGGGSGNSTATAALRPPTVLLISHDVAFLSAVTDETIIISPQKRALTYFPGPYDAFVAARRDAVRDAARSSAALEKQRKHAQASIAAGEKAAREKGDQKKLGMVASRRKKLDERFGLERGQKGGKFKLNRDYGGYFFTKRPPPPVDLLEEAAKPPPSMRFPRGAQPTPLRNKGSLLQVRGATYRYPGASSSTPPALKECTFDLPARARVVLLGRNGSGKSTLLGLLSGRLQLPPGLVERGHPSLRVAECGQHEADSIAARGVSSKDATATPRTAAEYISLVAPDLLGGKEQDARDACGGVGLGSVAASTPLAALSGGQRMRLALLAAVCGTRPHVLLLDEPTNFLALEGVAALADLLRAYSKDAAVVVATHDVDFADRLLRPGTGPVSSSVRRQGGGSDSDSDDEGAAGEGGGEDGGPEVACYVLRAGKLEPQHPAEGAASRYAGRVLARIEAREAAAAGRG
jgi:ATPase subunit of ABC transporter with duplicated ATPase domains